VSVTSGAGSHAVVSSHADNAESATEAASTATDDRGRAAVLRAVGHMPEAYQAPIRDDRRKAKGPGVSSGA
jgi:hypothetical protein